jgi:hypothetical protein
MLFMFDSLTMYFQTTSSTVSTVLSVVSERPYILHSKELVAPIIPYRSRILQ